MLEKIQRLQVKYGGDKETGMADEDTDHPTRRGLGLGWLSQLRGIRIDGWNR